MSNTAINAMPARAIPTGEGALPRPVIVFGSRPGVGTTTVAAVARSALAGGASLPRLLAVGDGLDGASPEVGAETLDFGPSGDADLNTAIVRLAEALAEGNVVVDCAAGVAGRVFAEAAAVEVGHIIAKRGGVSALVVVGPSPSSAVRAGAQVGWLTERGSSLGISRVGVVMVDQTGRKASWDDTAHAELRARIARSKIDVGRIPPGDLDLLARFGAEAVFGAKDADIAARLGVGEIEAAARASRLRIWLGSAADGLRAAGAFPAKAAAKAA